MVPMETPLMSATWSHLTHRFQEPFCPSKEGEICLLQLPKMGVNLAYKALIGLAMLVTLVVTPILFAIDVLSPKRKELKGGENVVTKHTILDFYQGSPIYLEGPNGRSRATLEEIWNYDDNTLEGNHKFIQWLFPLEEESDFNPGAAMTNAEVKKAFRQDPGLQEKMRKSFAVMLKFYGLTETGLAPNFNERAQVWLNRGNHNYLRITRILTSLRLHGCEAEAKRFFSLLEKVYHTHSSQIGAETFGYWQSAAQKT